jgi:DNA-binding SARP family transcriptional activator
MSEPTPNVLTFPEAATARFELQCWGEFSLSDRVRRAECSPRGRKARAIIAYLASHGGAVVGRERLAALLWSERGDPQARHSLRQTLRELRPFADEETGLLLIEHDHVRLQTPALTSDLVWFEASASVDDIAALSRTLGEIGDRLFGGLDGLDPAFDEWLALERRVQEDRLLSLATAAAERGLRRSEFGAVARLASQLQARDETNEAIAQIGMRADHACGDRSGLRRRYQRLCEGLREGLGVGPSSETEALFRELEGSEQPAGVAAAPVAPAIAAKADPTPTMPGGAAQDEAGPQLARIADAAEPTPSSSRRRVVALWTQRRRTVAVALLALLASAAGAAWLLRDNLPGRSGAVPRVQIAGFTALEADPEIRDFSVRLNDRVAGVLKDNLAGLSIIDPQDTASANTADLRLKGTVSREGDGWRVKAEVQDRRGVIIWAQDFQRSARQGETLEFEVAGAAGEALGDTVDALQERAARRDPQALALYVQSLDAYKNRGPMNAGKPLRLIEDAVARAPDFVGARGTLAVDLLDESENAPKEDRERLVLRARREAQWAIRTDPSAAGPAYDALHLIALEKTPADLAAADNLLIEGIAKAPRYTYLYIRRCSFLTKAGLPREAQPYCHQALAGQPLTAFSGRYYALDLYGQRAPQLAARVLQKSLRYHPDDLSLRGPQFVIAAFAGDPDDAAALERQPIDTGQYNSLALLAPEGARAFDLLLQARRSGAPADADKTLAAFSAAVADGKVEPRWLVWGAAALGRLDAAFATLDQIANGTIPSEQAIGDILFEGPSAPLWRDRRIWPLAAEAGYARYWRTRGVWPDFCRDPTLPYDCRTEAARVAQIKPLEAAGSRLATCTSNRCGLTATISP